MKTLKEAIEVSEMWRYKFEAAERQMAEERKEIDSLKKQIALDESAKKYMLRNYYIAADRVSSIRHALARLVCSCPESRSEVNLDDFKFSLYIKDIEAARKEINK